MLKDIIVIDDVFDDPELLVEQAEILDFYTAEELTDPSIECTNKLIYKDIKDLPGPKAFYRGTRTTALNEVAPKLINSFFEQMIFKSIYNDNNLHTALATVNFGIDAVAHLHRLTDKTIFNDTWIHTDPGVVYAAIVYLSKNPAPNSGTIIYKNNEKIVVENKFNRMVLYHANYPHSAMGGFGDSTADCRLTLNVFFRKINLELSSTTI